jgi:hypothetical protein
MDAIGKRKGKKSTDLDRFVSEQNIARYRKLLNPEPAVAERGIRPAA